MSERISIIIPTHNEAEGIGKLVAFLQNHGGEHVAEIIISDGCSTDETVTIAGNKGAVTFISPQKGRAAQMNFGASKATGNILYFIHADCFPPENFVVDILKAVGEGYEFGRYRSKYDSANIMLKINAWFTRFNWYICYGGDQTLFITRALFDKSSGFKNELLIMEEYEYAERLIKLGKYKIFSDRALISARKYKGRSWLKVQLANRKAVQAFKKGIPQQQIVDEYKMNLGIKPGADNSIDNIVQ